MERKVSLYSHSSISSKGRSLHFEIFLCIIAKSFNIILLILIFQPFSISSQNNAISHIILNAFSPVSHQPTHPSPFSQILDILPPPNMKTLSGISKGCLTHDESWRDHEMAFDSLPWVWKCCWTCKPCPCSRFKLKMFYFPSLLKIKCLISAPENHRMALNLQH